MAKRRKRKPTHDAVIRDYERSGQGQGRSEHMTVLDGQVSARKEILSHHEELQLRDEQGEPYQRDVTFVATCEFNHVVTEQNRIVGKCWICGALLCAARGCTFSCRKCGRVCCRTHTAIYDHDPEHIEIYCTRHRWAYWFGF